MGYVALSIETPAIDDETHTCLFLVIPDSQCNDTVPVLLGTNILTRLMAQCRDRHGVRYLQVANLTTPWYITFRSLAIRD